nr:hypothetical protein [Sulfurospirillum diekertiae]
MELDTSIDELCKELKLSIIGEKYHDIASMAAKENWLYTVLGGGITSGSR